MAKTKFKVTVDRVSVGGKTYKKGDIFEAETKSAHIVTALHFKQLQEVTAPTGEVVPPVDTVEPAAAVAPVTPEAPKEPEAKVDPEPPKEAKAAPKGK